MARIEKANSDHVSQLLSLDHIAAVEEARAEFIARTVENQSCWVIEENHRTLGYSVMDYGFFGFGFVRMLYVTQEHRRRGLASEMMLYLESICKTVKLFSSTNQSNQPAQRIMEKLGYSKSGIIENLDDGDPELVYFKRLK
ncbi:MAG: GNAT family N-acetyltransferase [candidate division Zixibacteria bacterium]|nr:GNAT family N-acetyltransferase [candidate division Zixibacteria bacterium]